jgi:hypothetical protein
MLIKYLGTGSSVTVVPYGQHLKDEVREYPDEFGADLLETSKRQRFEEDDGISATSPPLKNMTVPKLQSLCKKLGIETGPKDKKAELIALVEKHTAPPPEEKHTAEPPEE